MSRKFSKTLIEVIRESLTHATIYTSRDTQRDEIGYTFFKLEKGKLRALSNEDIEFLSNYVTEYRRGVYRIKPKSLQHFISSNKYEDGDEASFSISLKDLINAGVLVRKDEEEFSYWVLDGEVLDPGNYLNLYKADAKLYKTLHKHLGYLDIYERFAALIEQRREASLYHDTQISDFEYEGVHFTLHRESMTASTEIKDFGVSSFRSESPGSIRLWIKVSRPSVDDIDRVIEYVGYTTLLVKELIENLRTLIQRSTDRSVGPESILGFIDVSNYRIEKIDINIYTKLKEVGRERITFSVSYGFSRGVKNKSGEFIIEPKHVLIVQIVGALRSMPVYRLLQETDWRGKIEIPEDFDLRFDNDNKEVSLVYEITVPANIPIDFAKPYTVIENFKSVLAKLGEVGLESVKDKRVVAYIRDWYSRTIEFGTVGELLDAIKWGPTTDKDELVLKLVALRLKEGELIRKAKPPVLDYLIGLSVLYGSDQDSLSEKINDPLETLIEFIEKGKLKFKKTEEGIKILFKGMPIEEYISPSALPGKLGRALLTAIALMQAGEERATRKLEAAM